MRVYSRIFSSLVVLFLTLPAFAQQAGTTAALWRDRGDAATLDLLNGPGGKEHQPGTNFKFIEEAKSGTAPKFDVEDENGTKWKVKLGPEVKSETAATRLVWAAGYFADEDYYRPQIRVQGMKQLSRGQKYVSDGGLVREVRLERQGVGKKLKNWSWSQNPFAGTREFNGLRVMMALINNWDLKEINNGIFDVNGEPRYEVTDLGASFGSTGNRFGRSKAVMKDYAKTKFIEKVTPKSVDFVFHTKIESVGKNIPIADARWIGNRLGQFSAEQIGDCFRAAGFSPAEVEGYTRVVRQRIEALKKL
ncbi:MAG: hypothetical protein LAO07_07145 [Acidobacteriia bacterium]|nr:hypothetical protein [Terriglobia bacterium]